MSGFLCLLSEDALSLTESTPCDGPWTSLQLGSSGESWRTRASSLISEEAGSWQSEDLPGAPLLVGSEMGL